MTKYTITYLKKENESRNILMQAYAAFPQNPHVHKALGDYCFRFANYNSALEYYKLSLSSGNLEDFATNLAIAICYEKLGDVKMAISYFRIAQSLNPESKTANQRVEMYDKLINDGYNPDSRKYSDTYKVPEHEDTELENLIIDSHTINN